VVIGDTAIETNCAAVTVRPVVLLTPLYEALMLAVPAPAVVASPVLSMLATAGVSDVHAEPFVRSSVEPSVKLPVALNRCTVPAATDGFAGVTLMNESVADVTVNVLLHVTAPRVAVMVDAPALRLVALPWVPVVLLTVATLPALEFHCAACVTSWLVPSEN